MITQQVDKLALNIPFSDPAGGGSFTLPNINNFQTGPNTAIPSSTLGGIITGFANIAFLVGGFLMLFWFSWGVFQYIFAGGDKEKLHRARERITWAIIGFIILVISFFIAELVKGIFPQSLPKGVTSVTDPATGAPTACDARQIADCAVTSTVCRVVGGRPQCVAP